MSTTYTDNEVRQIRREVTDLRRDVQRLQSDLMWKESRQRFNRQITLLVVAIIMLFAAMGGIMALATVAAQR